MNEVGSAPLGSEGKELQRRHLLTADGERSGEAGSGVERRYRHRGRGQRPVQADAVALGDCLAAGPGCVKGVQPPIGRRRADRRSGAGIERPLGEAQQVSPRSDRLDVDSHVALARECDQRQAAGMAEVEAQARGGVGERRLAVLAVAKLDRCGVLVQIEGQNPAQHAIGVRPVERSAPDVHLVIQHSGEDS